MGIKETIDNILSPGKKSIAIWHEIQRKIHIDGFFKEFLSSEENLSKIRYDDIVLDNFLSFLYTERGERVIDLYDTDTVDFDNIFFLVGFARYVTNKQIVYPDGDYGTAIRENLSYIFNNAKRMIGERDFELKRREIVRTNKLISEMDAKVASALQRGVGLGPDDLHGKNLDNKIYS